jgi:hypothetical protein
MNTYELAEQLRQTWNNAHGNPHIEWADLHIRDQEAYLAVARKAQELCGAQLETLWEISCRKKDAQIEELCSKPQYRSLVESDIIQAHDEVWEFNRGPWKSVLESEYGQKYGGGGYYAMRRPVVVDKLKENYESISKVQRECIDWKEDEKHRVVGDNIIFKGASFPIVNPGPGVKVLLDVNADQRVQIEHLEKSLAAAVADKDAKAAELEAEAIRLHRLWHNAQEKLNVVSAHSERVERERDNWQEAAAQHSRNQEFYQGIVTDIGDMFGLPARLAADGTICEDVLALKVSDLVAQLIIDREKM